MHCEDWLMPGGWVSSTGISDALPADLQDAMVSSLVSAGWTIKDVYRASYVFGMSFRTAVPPDTALPDSAKSIKSCDEFHDYTAIIDNVQYVGYDPYRQFPPGAPCVGFELGESEGVSANNFMAAANGSPYQIEPGSAPPGAGGVGWWFKATAKQPGARGDAYQFAAPIMYFDLSISDEKCYPGYLMESPPDAANKKYQIHLWDGSNGDRYADYFHCFRVFDSYGGHSDIFALANIFRNRDTNPDIVRGTASPWYYTYEIIATEDSLLTIPAKRTDVDPAGNFISSTDDIYGDGTLHTEACLYICRPVATPDTVANGVETALFCHLPYSSYGYDEMLMLPHQVWWIGVNDVLQSRPGVSNWAVTAPVFPNFRSLLNEPKILTTVGDTLRTAVMMVMAKSNTEETGIVGKLNSVIAVADASYTVISAARIKTADGRDWKLIMQNNEPPRAGYYYNFSLWAAESTTDCGDFYDPAGTRTSIPHRAMSAVYNPLGNWTILPNSEAGNDAILFAGGEGLVGVSVFTNDPAWPIAPGSYPAGDPGGIYYEVTDQPGRHCSIGRYVRIWGFPDCDRVGHSYTYTFTATDDKGATINESATVTIEDATAWSMRPANRNLSAGVGVAASFTFSVGCPGTASYSSLNWSYAGTIVAGMSFTLGRPGPTAVLSGSPSAAGYFEFSVRADDPSTGNVVAWGKYNLTVVP